MSKCCLCPHCKTELSAGLILENCGVSWPNQKWLLFKCPECGRSCHVQLSIKKIELGGLDGAPGPAFFPSSEMTVDSLRFTTDGSGISCILEGKKYYFKTKR